MRDEDYGFQRRLNERGKTTGDDLPISSGGKEAS